MEANWNGHVWKCRWVNDAEFSVVCQDPKLDADGNDSTPWPTDDQVSELAGVIVEVTPRRTNNTRANIYRRASLVDEATAETEPPKASEPETPRGSSNG